MWRAYISGDEQDDAMAVEELAGRLSALWASSRLANVGNHTILPASIFVPEDAQRASPTAADCPFGDDAAQRPVSVRYRRHLDHELSLWHSDCERGVVEVLDGPEPGRLL